LQPYLTIFLLLEIVGLFRETIFLNSFVVAHDSSTTSLNSSVVSQDSSAAAHDSFIFPQDSFVISEDSPVTCCDSIVASEDSLVVAQDSSRVSLSWKVIFPSTIKRVGNYRSRAGPAYGKTVSSSSGLVILADGQREKKPKQARHDMADYDDSASVYDGAVYFIMMRRSRRNWRPRTWQK